MPRIRGFAFGTTLLLASVVLGVVFRRGILPAPGVPLSGLGPNPLSFASVRVIYGFATNLAPLSITVVLLWAGFASRTYRERYLWSAILVISAAISVIILDLFVMGFSPGGFLGSHRVFAFADVPSTSALLCYGSLYAMAVTRGFRSRAYFLLTLMVFIIVFPIVIEPFRWPSLICTLLAALGFWALGVTIADRSGFYVYARERA